MNSLSPRSSTNFDAVLQKTALITGGFRKQYRLLKLISANRMLSLGLIIAAGVILLAFQMMGFIILWSPFVVAFALFVFTLGILIGFRDPDWPPLSWLWLRTTLADKNILLNQLLKAKLLRMALLYFLLVLFICLSLFIADEVKWLTPFLIFALLNGLQIPVYTIGFFDSQSADALASFACVVFFFIINGLLAFEGHWVFIIFVAASSALASFLTIRHWLSHYFARNDFSIVSR